MKQQFMVSQETLQNFLNYLSKRPYAEVFKLIEELRTATPVLQEAQPEAAKEVSSESTAS